MKVLILLQAAFFLLTTSAQASFELDILEVDDNKETQNLTISNPAEGYELCRYNQELILKAYAKSSRERLNLLLSGILYEKSINTNQVVIEKLIAFYSDLLAKQIIADALKKSIKSVNLHQKMKLLPLTRISPVLQIDSNYPFEEMYEKYVSKELHSSMGFKLEKVTSEFFQEEIKSNLAKNLFLRGFLLRKSVLSLVKETLFETFEAGALTLGTIPLQAFVNSDETDLLESLKTLPRLVLNPDWRVSAEHGNSFRVWHTNCLAILRRPEEVDSVLKGLMKKDHRNFQKQIEFLMTSQEKQKFQSMESTSVRRKIIPSQIFLKDERVQWWDRRFEF